MFLQEVKDNLLREKRQSEKAAGPVGFGEAMLNFVRLRREEKKAVAATLDTAAAAAGQGQPGLPSLSSHQGGNGEGGHSHAGSDNNLARTGTVGTGLEVVVEEEADEHAAHGRGVNASPLDVGGGIGGMMSITSSIKRAVRSSFAPRSPTSTNTPTVRQLPSLTFSPTGEGILSSPQGQDHKGPLHFWPNQNAEKPQRNSLIGPSHAKVFAIGQELELEEMQGTPSHGEVQTIAVNVLLLIHSPIMTHYNNAIHSVLQHSTRNTPSHMTP